MRAIKGDEPKRGVDIVDVWHRIRSWHPALQWMLVAPKILEVGGRLPRTSGSLRSIRRFLSERWLATRSSSPRNLGMGCCSGVGFLEANGILLPDELSDGGLAPADDVLDAAAAASTAGLIAEEKARSLPDPPEKQPGGRTATIWY